LTIRIEPTSVVFGDTLLVQYGGGTSGRRSRSLRGAAVYLASQEVGRQILGVAANLLEAAPADLALAEARVSVRGAPGRSVSIAEVAEAAYDGKHVPKDQAPGLEATSRFKSEGTTFPFGSHLCVGESDAETGQVRIGRYVAVHDCGRLHSQLLVGG